MSKMRYGPRFQPTVASNKVGYDWRIDRDLQKERQRMAAHLAALPQWRRDLIVEKTVASRAKGPAAKKRRAEGGARREAEERMVETLRKAAEMIEFQLVEMMQHPRVDRGKALVDQNQIHNLLFHLKKKCGVYFENTEYLQRIDVSRVHMGNQPEPQDYFERSAEEFFAEQSEKQSARERKFRDVTDRLIARGKK